MSFEIIRNDITKVQADAIVNTANPLVEVGAGVDSAVYAAAGRDRLMAERKKIGPMQPGEVAVTPAFDLDADYIIHAVGPAWMGGDCGEVETVARCYRSSLNKAKELGCESIAFPLMASGTYGFPKDVALKTAVSEISGFLFNNEMTVYLVVYDKESFEVSGKAFSDISSFIAEEEVVEPDYRSHRRRRGGSFGNVRRNISAGVRRSAGIDFSAETVEDSFEDSLYGYERSLDGFSETDIDDVIKHKDESFQQRLFRLIDRKGLEDKDVYKKANIDRKHFSKIRSNVNYNPSKKTALALAIALGLNLDETKDLLLRAGIALSHSNTFDIIIEYCIDHHMTDIYEINCILFNYDQPTLGV